jgi:hypothetical protein
MVVTSMISAAFRAQVTSKIGGLSLLNACPVLPQILQKSASHGDPVADDLSLILLLP